MKRFTIYVLISWLAFCAQSRGQGGAITTVAGNQKAGFSGDGGPATSAELNYPQGIAVDSSGNLFISDYANQRIRKISANGTISTVAGNGTAGFSGDGGPATSASLNTPWGVAVDAAGNLFIADNENNRIRRVSTAGIITTVAGNGPSCSPLCGSLSGDGGPATAASLNQPLGIAVDASGNLFIADNGNGRIRKVSTSGIITVVAGGGNGLGDGGLATEASLSSPWGVALDASGNLFIADTGSRRIRKVSASSGIITTVAGNGNYGFSGDGGLATSAVLESPGAVEVDAYGNLFIADSGNNRIRRVSPSGVITTIAGGGVASTYLATPEGVAVDASGNLLILDSDNSRVLKVSGMTPSITTLPTNISLSLIAGASSNQQIALTSPGLGITWSASTSASWITLTPSSGTAPGAINLTVNSSTLQPGIHTASITITNPLAWPSEESVSVNVTVIPAAAAVSVAPMVLSFQLQQNAPAQSQGILVGGTSGIPWQATAAVSAERVWLGVSQGVGQIPASLTATVSSLGLMAGTYQGTIMVQVPEATPSSSNISVILTVTAAGGESGIITTVAGNGTAGLAGDGGAAPSAELNNPGGVAIDASGNLFIADTANNVVRKVSAGSGLITTIAGNGSAGSSGDDGPATSAYLSGPIGITVDASGNLFFADTGSSRIEKVSAASGVITTVAGYGAPGFSSPGPTAFLSSPHGVAVDAFGNIFIADSGNNRIVKVSANGTITTAAGNGKYGFSGDGGLATSASLSGPQGVAVDPSGNIFIADWNNERIRKVSTSGIITTVAGGGNVSSGVGDGGPANLALLSQPTNVSLDTSGNLFIADAGNNRIRKVSASGIITTVAGGGNAYPSDGRLATSAFLFDPTGIAVDTSGNLLIAEAGTNAIREVFAPSSTTPPAPSITPGGIVPVDSSVSTIQAGEWASIFGANLASSTMTWNGNFPVSLGGTSVTINAKAAYLSFISPTQINLQAPTDTATGPVSVVVTTAGGTATSTVTLSQFAPSFLLLDSKHVAGIILRPNGSGAYGGGAYDIIGPTGNSLGYATVAAKAGDTIELFGTGFGPTNPPVPAGQAFTSSAPTTNPVTLRINSLGVAPAFAGLSGAGVDQINLTVPAGLGTGDVSLVATVGGVQTPTGVVISLH